MYMHLLQVVSPSTYTYIYVYLHMLQILSPLYFSGFIVIYVSVLLCKSKAF